MKKITIGLVLFFACFALPKIASATGGWNGGSGGYWGTGGNSVPLDGGLSLLAVAGIGYGIKKYADYNKKEVKK